MIQTIKTSIFVKQMGRIVIFIEDGMRFICGIDENGKIIAPADSLVILGRVEEFQNILDNQ